MHLVAMAGRFSIDRLHQEKLEIIRGSEILGNTGLADSFLPEHSTCLATQPIPALLVIVHDGTEKIPLQFIKGHSTSLSRCFGIMQTIAGVGQTPLKALGHPAKEGFHSSFGPSRQLHHLPLWQKEFSRSPIPFIPCTASSLKSCRAATIGESTASRFIRRLSACGRCRRAGRAWFLLPPTWSWPPVEPPFAWQICSSLPTSLTASKKDTRRKQSVKPILPQ